MSFLDFQDMAMSEIDPKQTAEETKALLDQNEELLEKYQEVCRELRELMAEQLGCSVWDLDNQLDRDLAAEDRQALEEQARQVMLEMAPEARELLQDNPGAALSPTPAPPGAPRPRRRMV
jgi:hypothetical protein